MNTEQRIEDLEREVRELRSLIENQRVTKTVKRRIHSAAHSENDPIEKAKDESFMTMVTGLKWSAGLLMLAVVPYLLVVLYETLQRGQPIW